jgi:nucleoside 2-deoxyribosyltransferase
MNIYFAGSIRGGRNDVELYHKIIAYLQTKGTVLTEHVGHDDISAFGENGSTDREIYQRDMAWLNSANVVVAEVTQPSLGVGFEIANAVAFGKKVFCLYHKRDGIRLSPMIAGCNDVQVVEYGAYDEVEKHLNRFLQ